ncbi:MAG: hypothetical protein H6721_29390 [Sandaracinus sp.]|nr:hypothetical protein [Sandaracinus sp.]MCB9618456.1 hypothetical protein [Sandaracinus sp.]MCB9624415.1 hypothetical protein [Sandaracinus sp.]MCB9636245.1 hypothetical protein [Sandaracinus sp.]
MSLSIAKLRERLTAFHADERGGVSLEYVVILVLIAIIGIVAWVDFKEAVRDDAADEYQQFGYPPTEG